VDFEAVGARATVDLVLSRGVSPGAVSLVGDAGAFRGVPRGG
jgi:hypothetical protein